MPGSHPSNSPITDSNDDNGSAVNENDNVRQYRQYHQHHTYDQRQQASHVHQSRIYDADSYQWSHEHRHDQLGGSWTIDMTGDRALTNERRHDGRGWIGDDYIQIIPSHQQWRPTSNGSGSTDQPHRIESYIDREDYRYMVAGVSSIRMSSPRSGEDGNVSELDDSLTHSPYSTQVEEPIDGDSDQRIVEGDEVALIFDAILSETDRGQDTREELVSDDIYDTQHIMVHNQRMLEHQIRQSRADYSESPTRRPLSFRYLDGMETLETLDIQSFETNSVPLIQDEDYPAAAPDQYSPTYNLGGFHQQPSMSISASYFSPSTESTIVLSSPPPGRVSGTFPYSSQSSMHPFSARSAYRSGHVEVASYTGSAPNHGGGPYTPFITGRELAAQQQQSPLDPRPPWPGAISLWEEELPEQSSDIELDMDGGRIISGDSEGGRWSMFGSVTRGNSFEEHRHRHHHRHRQYQSQQGGALGVVSESRPAAFAMGLGANTLLSRVPHQESHRRSPHTSSFPGRGNTNIPIPSRYINPQPFNHTQFTASTGSHIFRPHDISTGYNHHNGYRRPGDSFNSSGNSRLRSVHSQSRPYSETIERAETGGWTAPNLTSTAGSTTSSSQWRDLGQEYTGRADIGMKEVIRMACRFCETVICERGMKAQLLADHTIGLMSTDDDPHSVQFVGEEYRPTNCYCKIMDTACLVCGNIIGYHITQPCSRCLNADNNGHHWLFHPEYIVSCSRWDPLTQKPLRWAELPSPEQDLDALSLTKVQVGSRGGQVILGGMVRRDYHVICR